MERSYYGRPKRSQKHCKSCAAPIDWAITIAGKKVPLDKEPREDGNFYVLKNGLAIPVTASPERIEEAKGQGAKRYMNHFVTCPNRDLHKRR